jgi:hypothetical protein
MDVQMHEAGFTWGGHFSALLELRTAILPKADDGASPAALSMAASA